MPIECNYKTQTQNIIYDMNILSIYYDIRILSSINCINIYLMNPHSNYMKF